MVSGSQNLPAEALNGKLLISTRPEKGSEILKECFTGAGAELIEFPMIKVKPVTIGPAGRMQLKNAGTFDWILFTSGNGVRYFMQEMKGETGSFELPARTRIAAIGPGTARVLKEYKLHPRFTSRFSNADKFSEELASIFKESYPRVLWPTGYLASGTLMNNLNGLCEIHRLNVYETVMPEFAKDENFQRIIDDRYDLIFFFSPSAVKNFCLEAKEKNIDVSGLRVACIGPVTMNACLSMNIEPLFMSSLPDSYALLKSTIEYYSSKEKNNGLS
jgi:uroporphyrinogen-III synthase